MDMESNTAYGNIEHKVLGVESFEDIIDVENEMGFGEGEDWGSLEDIDNANLSVLEQIQNNNSVNDGFEQEQSYIPVGRPTVMNPLASSLDSGKSSINKDTDGVWSDQSFYHQGHLMRDGGGKRKSVEAFPFAASCDGEQPNNNEDVGFVSVNHFSHQLSQGPNDGKSMTIITPASLFVKEHSRINEDLNLVPLDHHGHNVVQAPEDFGQKRSAKALSLSSASDFGDDATVTGDVGVVSLQCGHLLEDSGHDQNAAVLRWLQHEYEAPSAGNVEESETYERKLVKENVLKSQGKEMLSKEGTASNHQSFEDSSAEVDNGYYSSHKVTVVKKGILKSQGKEGHMTETCKQTHNEESAHDSLIETNSSRHSPQARLKHDGVPDGIQDEKSDTCKDAITKKKREKDERSGHVNKVRFSLDYGMDHAMKKAADFMVGEKTHVQKELHWKFGGASQNERFDYIMDKELPKVVITTPKRRESAISECLQDPNFDLRRSIEMREDKKKIRLANERIKRLEDGLQEQHAIMASMRVSLASGSLTDFGKVRMLVDSLEKNIRKLNISKTKHLGENHQQKGKARQIEKLKAQVNLLDAGRETLKKKLDLAVQSLKNKEKEYETLRTEREKVLQRRVRELEKSLEDQQNKSLPKPKEKEHEISTQREKGLEQTVKELQKSVEDWKSKFMRSKSKTKEHAILAKEREKALERRVKELEKSLDDLFTTHIPEGSRQKGREHGALMNERGKILEGRVSDLEKYIEDWPSQHVFESSKLKEKDEKELITEHEKSLEQRVMELENFLHESFKLKETGHDALVTEREIVLQRRGQELEISLHESSNSKQKEYEVLIMERENALQRRVKELEISLSQISKSKERECEALIVEREKALQGRVMELEKSLDDWEAKLSLQSSEREKVLEQKFIELEKSLNDWEVKLSSEREKALEGRLRELEQCVDDWETRNVVACSKQEKYLQRRVNELENSLEVLENKLILHGSKGEEQVHKSWTVENDLERKVKEIGKCFLENSKSEEREHDALPTEQEKALEKRVKELEISLEGWESQIAVESSEKKYLESRVKQLEAYLKGQDKEPVCVSSESKEKEYEGFTTEQEKALQRGDLTLSVEQEKALDRRVTELEKSLEVWETKFERSKAKERGYDADRENALERRVQELEKFLEDWDIKLKKIECDFASETNALEEKSTTCKVDWNSKTQTWALKLKDRETEVTRLKALENALVECSVSCSKSLEKLKNETVALVRELMGKDAGRIVDERDPTQEMKIPTSYSEEMTAVEMIQKIETGINHVHNVLCETSSELRGKHCSWSQDPREESQCLDEKVAQTLGLMATLKQEMKAKEDAIKAENKKYALMVAEKTKQVEALENQLTEKEQDMESFVQELKDEVSLLNKELEREHKERSRLLNELHSQGDAQRMLRGALKEQDKIDVLNEKLEEMKKVLFLKDKRIMSLEEDVKEKAALLVQERQKWTMAIKEVKQKAARTILRFARGKENGLLEHLRERRKAQREAEEESIDASKAVDDNQNATEEKEHTCITMNNNLQTHVGVKPSDERTPHSFKLDISRVSTHSADLSVYGDMKNYIEPNSAKLKPESGSVRRKELKVIPRAYCIEGMDSYEKPNSEFSEMKQDSKREIFKLLQRKRWYEEKQSERT